MQQYRIQEVEYSHDYTDNWGDKQQYNLTLVDNEGIPYEVFIGQKTTTPAPKPGQVVEGDILEQSFNGRNKFKKAQQQSQTQTAPAPRQAPPSAPRTAPSPSNDEQERQRMIIRQSALKAAVDLFSIKAQSMTAEEVKSNITKERIVEVAKFFAHYSETGETE